MCRKDLLNFERKAQWKDFTIKFYCCQEKNYLKLSKSDHFFQVSSEAVKAIPYFGRN